MTACVFVGGSAHASYTLMPLAPAGLACCGEVYQYTGEVEGLAIYQPVCCNFKHGEVLALLRVTGIHHRKDPQPDNIPAHEVLPILRKYMAK